MELRVYDRNLSEWVYFNPLNDCVANNPLIDPDTLGQFTTVSDKTGKKIFTGDYVAVFIGKPELLTNGNFKINKDYVIGEVISGKMFSVKILGEKKTVYAPLISEMLEVIGDIVTTPEFSAHSNIIPATIAI